MFPRPSREPQCETRRPGTGISLARAGRNVVSFAIMIALQAIIYVALLAIGVTILVKSADWFTEAAVEVARRLQIPEIIIGITLVSLATTLPEFAVSFLAAIQGKVDVAVGNAIGSTICNVGLILGLCSLLSPMAVEQKGFVRNGVGLLILATAFGIFAVVLPEGSRWVGVVMVAGLAVYLGSILGSSRNDQNTPDQTVHQPTAPMPNVKVATLFLLGTIGVLGSSQLVVFCAEHLAQLMGVSQLVISLTLVALGTSTPELAVSIMGIIKKRRALAIGNVIGANILNLAWVIGACSLVRPLPVTSQTRTFDIPTTLTLSVLLLVFGMTGRQLARWEGAVLMAIYLTWLTAQFTIFGTAPAP